MILFYSHKEKTYKTDQFRAYFSQFYQEEFVGKTKGIPYELPIDAKYIDNVVFMCRESYMHACKALIFGDLATYDKIIKEINPNSVKSLGRKVKGFKENTWKDWAYKIVVNGNYLQFSQNDKMKKALIDTKDSIIAEASSDDNIWGIGKREINIKNVDELKKLITKDNNLLGKALMEVRDILNNN